MHYGLFDIKCASNCYVYLELTLIMSLALAKFGDKVLFTNEYACFAMCIHR